MIHEKCGKRGVSEETGKRLEWSKIADIMLNIRLETKSCRISYGKLTVKYDKT